MIIENISIGNHLFIGKSNQKPYIDRAAYDVKQLNRNHLYEETRIWSH